MTLGEHPLNIGEGHGAVDLGLTGAEPVKIRAIQDEDARGFGHVVTVAPG